ncbi:MAG: hypothetical protein WBA66_15590 [Xanthobacteraceae bacterium]|jgi:hypothetical protein
MLRLVTRVIRIRAALVLAILFGVCTIAPSLALAVATSPAAAHCLTDDHHGTAKAPAHHHDGAGAAVSHADSAQDQTSGDKSSDGAPASCCGVLCLTAMSASASPLFGPQINASALFPALENDVTGGGPDRINRPPIASLSM